MFWRIPARLLGRREGAEGGSSFLEYTADTPLVGQYRMLPFFVFFLFKLSFLKYPFSQWHLLGVVSGPKQVCGGCYIRGLRHTHTWVDALVGAFCVWCNSLFSVGE